MPDAVMLFAARMREAKAARKVSWKKLAELTYINRGTLLWYRRGKGYPSVGRIIAIACVLQVSVDWLLGLREEP